MDDRPKPLLLHSFNKYASFSTNPLSPEWKQKQRQTNRDLLSPMSLNASLEAVLSPGTLKLDSPRFFSSEGSLTPSSPLSPLNLGSTKFSSPPPCPRSPKKPSPLERDPPPPRAIGPPPKGRDRPPQRPRASPKPRDFKACWIRKMTSTPPPRPEQEPDTQPEMDVTVFIGNLPPSVSESEIMQSFRVWGFPLLRSRMRIASNTSNSAHDKNICFVDVPNLRMAEAMVRKFNRKSLFGSDCIRVEIEKKHAISQSAREDPTHNDRIQSLLKGRGWVSLPQIFKLYHQTYRTPLRVLDDTHLLKLLVKCDNLLILNAKGSERIAAKVWVYSTNAPTFNSVVKILKRRPDGLPMNEFQSALENKFGFKRGELNRFDLDSFLRRWRVVQIEEGKPKIVKLSPSNLHTVFLGCLGQATTSNDIAKELKKIGFPTIPIRIKHGNGSGNTMAFVDVPSYKDAQRVVEYFHGKRLLGGTSIRAEIEKSCAGKRVSCIIQVEPRDKRGRVYALLNEAKGKIRLSQLVRRYKIRYGQDLSRSNNSLRTLIQMDMLLLFNTKNASMSQDIFIVRTPELGPKIVRNICACFPEGLSVQEFQLQLEGRLGQKLGDCDIRSFLSRWRFLDIRSKGGSAWVYLKAAARK